MSNVLKCGHKWGVHWKCQLPPLHEGACTDYFYREPGKPVAVVEGTVEGAKLDAERREQIRRGRQ